MIDENYMEDWRFLSLSRLTPIIFHVELTHLDSEASMHLSFIIHLFIKFIIHISLFMINFLIMLQTFYQPFIDGFIILYHYLNKIVHLISCDVAV